ncbi:hypothetical protein ACFWZ7_24900 [Nocardiopsis alba]|uniref:hypothetical protein n=1 Tax=Nocardiopsis alba TaxID=53437 RepID=UPI00366B8890
MTVPPEAHYEHVELIGRDVHLQTIGSVSLTGELRPPRHDCHVIEIAGVEILIPVDATRDLSLPNRGPDRVSGQAGHALDDVIDHVEVGHWADANAYSGAAAAVLGTMVGLQVTEVTAAANKTDTIGSKVDFADGSCDGQEAAVHLLSQPLAHARRLAELGYGTLTQAAADELIGRQNRATIRQWLTSGWILWIAQAQRDTDALLDEPAVWEAIGRVAERLAAEGRLDGDRVRQLVGDPTTLTTHRVWVHDYDELKRVQEQIIQAQGDELVEG